MMFGLKQFLGFGAFCLKRNVVECFKRDHEIMINLQSTTRPQECNAHLVEVSEGAVSSRKWVRRRHCEITNVVSVPIIFTRPNQLFMRLSSAPVRVQEVSIGLTIVGITSLRLKPAIACELKCSAVLCDRAHDVVRSARRNFGFDFQCNANGRSNKPGIY